ncbi:hypothetical protein Zm00014a_039402 [Zea mays]|jgi:hypothetical protein|uniref:Pectinesterase n=1 Tax=Zea mays TaxID=4577 RepID=A0A3L6F028_MAIZE|nr:hypothetical protein Zm00014a_039402 [Zea mays]
MAGLLEGSAGSLLQNCQVKGVWASMDRWI